MPGATRSLHALVAAASLGSSRDRYRRRAEQANRCVFYKVTKHDFEQDDDGLAALDELNIIDINTLDDYFEAVGARVR